MRKSDTVHDLPARSASSSEAVISSPVFYQTPDCAEDGESGHPAFLDLFNANDPLADFQQDGSFDFFDVSAFLAAFAAGCP